MKCRNCNHELCINLVDLGFSPPSNSYLDSSQLHTSETYFPLRVMVCENCFLAQTVLYDDFQSLFTTDYAYFSSVSKSWLEHAKNYCELMVEKLSLCKASFVIEIASNDGYLLKNFVRRNIPCLGIEPAYETALESRKEGIETIVEFFSASFAEGLTRTYPKPDLIIANNVLAHVPNINDFIRGLKILLNEKGVITIEFPHLLNLIKLNQFDTIYHEHFSYLSLNVVKRMMEKEGLKIWDVEEISTHGGSLRLYISHIESNIKIKNSVEKIIASEINYGLEDISTYEKFQARVEDIKNEFLQFLLKAKAQGKTVVGYGAAAKGSTLLNYGGVKSDLLKCIFDAAPSKQRKFMPGSHIPIYPASTIESYNADYVVIFPWNIATEIINELGYLRENGVKFLTVVPGVTYV